MAQVVFILGAGASRHAGAPLMNEFLEAAWDTLLDGRLGEAERKDFELVRRGVNELQVAHSKSDLDIWNVESVFDAFEMAALVGRLGDVPPHDVRRLPEAMRLLIVETIRSKVQLPLLAGPRHEWIVAASRAYGAFVDGLGAMRQRAGSYPAVITFNYDVCLDYALAVSRRSYSYCLDNGGGKDTVALMKLHGSLNWGYCGRCEKVEETRLQELVSHHGAESVHLREVLPAVPPPCPECKGQREALIVPPTLSKAEHQRKLGPVWEAAAHRLSEAEHVFVCGYSLPETDLFFRYLFAVGSIGGAALRRFWVWDPQPEVVRSRFQRLLGPQLLGQPDRFQVFDGRFEDVAWKEVVSPVLGAGAA